MKPHPAYGLVDLHQSAHDSLAGLYKAPRPLALLDGFVEFGKPPVTVMRTAVEEVFFHCPKAIMRAGLWSEDAKMPHETLPSLGQMISDQLGLARPDTSTAQERARAQEQL